MSAINLGDKLAQFSDHWSPKIVGQFNGNDIMVVKVEGEFVWHAHADTDDFFMVLKGEIDIEMRDRTVTLREGEMFVVPKGAEHRPVARQEAHLLLIEPQGTPEHWQRRDRCCEGRAVTSYARHDLPADIAVFAGEFESQPLVFAHLLDVEPQLDLTHVEVIQSGHLARLRARFEEATAVVLARGAGTLVLILPAAYAGLTCPVAQTPLLKPLGLFRGTVPHLSVTP